MTGIIRYFIFHRTAVNLLMVFVLVVGVAGYVKINTQLWPTWETRNISVSIMWPGASADAMDRLVTKPLDQELNNLRGRKDLKTYSYPGSVYASINFDEQTDMDVAFSEVQNKVSSITTFPRDIQSPIVTLALPLEHVTRILVNGKFSNRVARQLSETLKDALEEQGVKNIRVQGLKKPEIYLNLDPAKAREYGLTPSSVAEMAKSAIRDGGGGVYRHGDTYVSARVDNSGGTAKLGGIQIDQSNQTLTLNDVATISHEYPPSSYGTIYQDGNGFFLQILRNVDEDSIAVTANVHAAIKKTRSEIPPGVTIKLYDTRANQIRERLWLLFENAMLGLALVAATLFVFLNARAAVSVVVGIPVAFAATFCLMWITGQTINMVSAFAMVMVLGIIVDDAIVVAENIVAEQAGGNTPLDDAFNATTLMWRPVLTATLTTIAAFAPIVFLTDVFGSYVKTIPYFVCAALVASLIECFILLPGHMRAGGRNLEGRSFLRGKIDGWFDWISQIPFRRLITSVCHNRLIPALIIICVLGFAGLLVATNAVRFQFWLNPESNFLYANATLTAGSTEDARKRIINDLWAALEKAEMEAGYESGELTRATFALEGYHFARGGRSADPERVSVFLELADPDGKRILASNFAEIWSASMPQSADLQALAISPNRAGPAGRDIHLVLKGEDLSQVEEAVLRTEAALSRIEGVQQISNSLASGQLEAVLNLRPEGLEAGLKGETLSRQLFGGISGVKAHHVEDEGQSLDVWVRFARQQDFDALLDLIPVQAPDGRVHSVHTVADIGYVYAKNKVTRQNGQISVSVTANVDRNIIDASAVWRVIDEKIAPSVQADTGVALTHKGKREERERAFDEITWSFIIGVIAIYCILAWSMESIWWPFAVMAVLPLGGAGAIIGHYILDYKLTMLSLVSLVALFGILVNDSIILFEEIRRRNAQGQNWRNATVTGYMARLRPVLLTTVTTIAGLAPLILEQSYQAQFLIPIAITITWGLAIATLGSFLLVPVIVEIFAKLKIEDHLQSHRT